jgi:AraC-like DNA-binding protein
MADSEPGPVSLDVGPAVAHYPPGATFGPLRLPDFELVWLLSGSASWRRVGSAEQCRLTTADVLLLTPGIVSEFAWDPRQPTRHAYVHFGLRADPAGWPRVRFGQLPGPLGGMLDYLVWLGTRQPAGWRTRAEDVLSAAVRAFVCGPLPPGDLQPEPAPLAAALDHVQRAWRDRVRPVPLPELASAASVSQSYLARLFRDHYGCGAVTGLELVRLDRGRTLLTRSNLSVTEVARACGFADPLHFSRRFKAAYGVAPREYRRAGTLPVAGQPLVARLSGRLQADR